MTFEPYYSNTFFQESGHLAEVKLIFPYDKANCFLPTLREQHFRKYFLSGSRINFQIKFASFLNLPNLLRLGNE